MKPSRWLAAAAVLALLSLLACAPRAEPTSTPTPGPGTTPPLAQATATPTPTPTPAPRRGGTLNFGADATLKTLDPVWTTAAVTNLYAIELWEPLFAWDASFEARPMVAERWEASDDLRSWTITIREGITYHDGTTRTADDVIPSMERWGARAPLGTSYFRLVDRVEKVDERTVRITFNKPFGLAIAYLSNAPYIMPKGVASKPADERIETFIGSGPFRLLDWREGDRLVFERYEGYQPRGEPTSGRAGARLVYVDRVVSKEVPDAATRVSALEVGELDAAHLVPPDFLTQLSNNPRVRVYAHKPGSIAMTVFNNVFFPSDQQKFREAVALVQDPREYMALAYGPEELWDVCSAVFFCGGKWETHVAEDRYLAVNVERARQLIQEVKQETGWDGKVIVMTNTDYSSLYQLGQITERDLREKLGLTVDFQVMDWATLVTRRAEKQGWNIFHTGWSFAGAHDPFVAGWLGPQWFAWYDNAEMQRLQEDLATAPDDAARMRIVEQIQEKVYQEWPIVPHGMSFSISARGQWLKEYLELDGFTAVWWNAWLDR